MKSVIQRVREAQVSVDDSIVGQIGLGLLILLGVAKTDNQDDGDYLVRKCCELRIFADEQGKMNRSLLDVGGEVLVVSQFTLYGRCLKGRRPSFDQAAEPDMAERLYEYVVDQFRQTGLVIATGQFASNMQVQLLNDGPVTFILDSDHL